MGWFSAVQLSEVEVTQVLTSCKAKLSALTACQAANAGNTSACRRLEVDVVYCMAERVCKDKAQEFRACFAQQHGDAKYEGRLRTYKDPTACEKQVDAMKSCLKAQSLYPKHFQPSASR